MAVVHYVSKVTPLPGGGRLIRGILNFCSNYTASGDPVNLSNYFKSTSSPTVVCSSADGYAIEHNQGTAASGTLLAYQNVWGANVAMVNQALVQVHSNADLSSTNIVFFATGQHKL
jgi:hypothetical protein